MIKTLNDRQWLKLARSSVRESDLISMRLVLLCIQLMLFTACVNSATAVKYEDLDVAPYGEAKQVGRLNNRSFTELSGLTQSQGQNDLFWSHNDGGNAPVLFALNRSGRLKAKLWIEQTRNRDWEDLDSFVFEQQAYFLVADVGDNFAQRDHIQLHVIREPKLTHLASEQFETTESMESLTAPILYTLQIKYKEGPRDCEAVAIDIQQQKVLLLSKRDEPALLFEVSLRNVFDYLRRYKKGAYQTNEPMSFSLSVADSTVKQRVSPRKKTSRRTSDYRVRWYPNSAAETYS